MDNLDQYLAQEVEYLDPADEGEACEEPHGASYSRQLVHKLGCSVLQKDESNMNTRILCHLLNSVKC